MQVLRLRLAQKTRQTPLRMTVHLWYGLPRQDTSVLSLKFAEKGRRATAGPSTAFGQKNGQTPLRMTVHLWYGLPRQDTSVLSLKFAEKGRRANAGPSTAFGAENAPNSAQDDSSFVVRTSETGH